MKYVKSTLIIVALFSAYTAFAAKSTTKAQPTQAKSTTQAKPAAKGNAQARGKTATKQPVVQPDQYEQILTTIKATQPFSKNYSTLKEIKAEVERQIREIESTFARIITPGELKTETEQAMINESNQNPETKKLQEDIAQKKQWLQEHGVEQQPERTLAEKKQYLEELRQK